MGIHKYHAESYAVTEVLCMSYAEPYAVLCGASTGLRAKCFCSCCFLLSSFSFLVGSFFVFCFCHLFCFLFFSFISPIVFCFLLLFFFFFFPETARIPTTSYAECYARPKAHKTFQNSCVRVYVLCALDTA